MESLLSEIQSSRQQVKKERGRVLNKLDDLIAEATQSAEFIEANQEDQRACNQRLVQCVRKGQANFKKVVNLNKNYYDVLSRQSKSIV